VDICFVCETWLNSHINFSIPNYLVYRNDRINSNGGGGVALLIKNTIKHKSIPKLKTKVFENIGIEIILNDQTTIKLFSIYFSGKVPKNNKNNFKIFYKQDLCLFSRIKGRYIIGGDFNSKSKSWGCTRANCWGNLLWELVQSNKFSLLFPPDFTYIPANRKCNPSTIDLFITNIPEFMSQPKVLHQLSSDHLPVTIDLYKESVNLQPTFFDYKSADWNLFKRVVLENIEKPTNLDTIIHPYQIDNMISNLKNSINIATETAIPSKPVTPYFKELPQNILDLIKKRNNVRRKWCRTHELIYFAQMKYLNYMIRLSIKKFKNDDWSKMLNGLKKGSKPFWKVTKIIKSKRKPIPALKVDNEIFYSTEDKARVLATHFCNKFKTSEAFPDSVTEAEVSNSIRSIDNVTDFNFEKIKNNEVSEIISQLKPRKAPGPDNISNICIKKLPHIVILYMTFIFNSCLKLSYFPSEWKEARVITILKPNKPYENPNSYRPISLLNGISKIFEKIIKRKMCHFISEAGLFPDEQFGFRNEHSTTHPLFRIKKFVKNNLKRQNSVGMVALDINSAFDSVWHEGLLHKMKQVNFPIYLIKIVQSFLNERYFRVKINSIMSEKFFIRAGVPQGSVLGPILYNIFTFDIPKFNNTFLSMFADDTAIYTAHKYPANIVIRLQLALDAVAKYFLKWKISINVEKTVAIYFTRRRNERYFPSHEIQLNNKGIPWCQSIKYLGIIFDTKMIFNKQIGATVDKINKLIRILYPFINRNASLSTCNKLLLFKVVFQPILLYGAAVWHDCAKSHINKLQVAQNKILKMMLNLPFYFSTARLHSKTGIDFVVDKACQTYRKFCEKNQLSSNSIIKNLTEAIDDDHG
jgi:hypothetical protein